MFASAATSMHVPYLSSHSASDNSGEADRRNDRFIELGNTA
jgi:hypothetical protein